MIIPSFNGAEKLPALLASILSQSKLPAEIIVALDGSTDGSKEVIDQLNSSLVKVIEQDNGGRASIRNFGASKAKHQALVFIDDDMVLLPDSLKALCDHLDDLDKECLVVGLCRLLPEGNSSLLEQWRIKVEEAANSRLTAFERISLEKYRFTSGLLYMDKSSFDRLNGFDERLNDSEDFDLSMRALEIGSSIYFAKRFEALHRDGRSIQEFIARKVQYWNGKQKLSELYPHYRELAPQQFVTPKTSLSKMILYPFNYSAFWRMVFGSKSITALIPKTLSFKLLDRVVYSTAMLRYINE